VVCICVVCVCVCVNVNVSVSVSVCLCVVGTDTHTTRADSSTAGCTLPGEPEERGEVERQISRTKA
jgi:hypothetical protein